MRVEWVYCKGKDRGKDKDDDKADGKQQQAQHSITTKQIWV